MGMLRVRQGDLLYAGLLGFGSVVSRVPLHVGLNVQDETPQTLFNGLLDKGFDNVMGFPGSRSADDLDVFMEGFSWYYQLALLIQNQGELPEVRFLAWTLF